MTIVARFLTVDYSIMCFEIVRISLSFIKYLYLKVVLYYLAVSFDYFKRICFPINTLP